MALTLADVRRIAHLARMRSQRNRRKRLWRQLNDIFAMIAQMK